MMTRGFDSVWFQVKVFVLFCAVFGALSLPAAAKGKISFVNASRTTMKVKLYKGNDGLRCRPFEVPYKKLVVKPGKTAKASCKGNSTGGCYVELEVKDLYGQFRGLLKGDAGWSCAKIQGDARMRLTGDWNGSSGYSLGLTCYRTDVDEPQTSCLVRFVKD